MSAVSTWSTTAASNNLAPPDGWPEGQAPSTVNDVGREMIASLRTQFEDAQWFNDGKTKTRVSTTQFRIDGEDVTSAYHVGRRVKFVGTLTGTIYGRISVTAFSTDTTVTVVWDSGSLTNETLTGSYGILTSVNPSLGRIDGIFHVISASAGAGTATSAADELVVESGGDGGLTIRTPNASQANIYWGGPGDEVGSLARWHHDNGLFQIGSAAAGGEVAILSGDGVEAIRIDSSQNIGFGIASGFAALLHLRGSATDLLNLESTDSGAGAGPKATLHRNSASPVAGDLLGQLVFEGEDAGSAVTIYGFIRALIRDTTAGQEDGVVAFGCLEDNVSKQMRWGPNTLDEGASIFIENASPSPTTNPSSGGLLYCSAGALRYRGSSGTDVEIAAA